MCGLKAADVATDDDAEEAAVLAVADVELEANDGGLGVDPFFATKRLSRKDLAWLPCLLFSISAGLCWAHTSVEHACKMVRKECCDQTIKVAEDVGEGGCEWMKDALQ